MDAHQFLARLCALVPPPGVHMTRYYGVFASHHRLRERVIPRHFDARQNGPTRSWRSHWRQRPLLAALQELREVPTHQHRRVALVRLA
jgi:hypothetical protein